MNPKEVGMPATEAAELHYGEDLQHLSQATHIYIYVANYIVSNMKLKSISQLQSKYSLMENACHLGRNSCHLDKAMSHAKKLQPPPPPSAEGYRISKFGVFTHQAQGAGAIAVTISAREIFGHSRSRS